MNSWDMLTWAAAVALAGSGIVIFAFFLRDVRGILSRDIHHGDDESPAETEEPRE